MNDFDRYAEAKLARGILATFAAIMAALLALACLISGDFPAAALAAIGGAVAAAIAKS
jgi:hypothetical protein